MANTRLNAQIIKEITDALEVAVPFKHAAEGAGIAESTAYEWLERGKRPSESPKDRIYQQFAGAVTRARAQAVKNFTVIALGGGKGSSAAMFLLERRFRDEYGPVQKVVTESVDDIARMTPDERAKERERIERLRTARGGEPAPTAPSQRE